MFSPPMAPEGPLFELIMEILDRVVFVANMCTSFSAMQRSSCEQTGAVNNCGAECARVLPPCGRQGRHSFATALRNPFDFAPLISARYGKTPRVLDRRKAKVTSIQSIPLPRPRNPDRSLHPHLPHYTPTHVTAPNPLSLSHHVFHPLKLYIPHLPLPLRPPDPERRCRQRRCPLPLHQLPEILRQRLRLQPPLPAR